MFEVLGVNFEKKNDAIAYAIERAKNMYNPVHVTFYGVWVVKVYSTGEYQDFMGWR